MAGLRPCKLRCGIRRKAAGLYWMVEEGVTDLDDIPCAQIADLKLDRERAKASPDRALSARRGPIEINRRRSKRFGGRCAKTLDGRDAFPESLAALSRRADRGRRRGDPHHRGQSNSRGRHRRAGRRVGESSQMCTEMARPEIRTPDPQIRSLVLYPVSYGRTRHFRKAAKSAAGNVGRRLASLRTQARAEFRVRNFGPFSPGPA